MEVSPLLQFNSSSLRRAFFIIFVSMSEKTWSSEPETNNKVVKLFRNFCAAEYDGGVVYPDGPNYKEWFTTTVIDFVR